MNAFCRQLLVVIVLELNYEKSLGHLACCSTETFEGLDERTFHRTLRIPDTETGNVFLRNLEHPRDGSRTFLEIKDEANIYIRGSKCSAIDGEQEAVVNFQMDVKLGESQQNNGSLSLSLTTCGSSSAGHDMVVNFSFRVDLPAQAQATVGLWSIDASGHQGDRVTGAAWWPSALVAMLQDGRWHCVKVQIVARDHFSVHLDTRQLITARLTNGSAHSGLQVKQGIVNCGKDTEHQCMNELKVETKLLSLSIDDVKVQSTNQRQDQNGYVIQADSGRKINQATARSSWSEKFHRVLEHWLFAIIYYSFAFVPITCYFTWLYKCYMQPQLEDERNDGVEEEEVSGDEDAEDEDDAKKEK